MALDAFEEKYIPKDNAFYRQYIHYFLIGLLGCLSIILVCTAIVFYQVSTRPLPTFFAQQPDGSNMPLIAFQEPNLLPETLLRFASKAAMLGYNFDFVNYSQQIQAATPYFTPTGWAEYNNSIAPLIKTIVANQLFVYGVVSGPPVISNEGPLPGIDYAWRIQIPFSVKYRGGDVESTRRYYVVLVIVRVPTSTNPQGIGISQFLMV